MVDDDPVLLEVKGGVAVVSLNRPDQHNMVGDAADALFFRYLDLLRTDRDVRVVVWRGGPRSRRRRPRRAGTTIPVPATSSSSSATSGRAGSLYDFPIPIICALKGWVLGIQLERALLCDMRVAAESAALALPAVDHGVIRTRLAWPSCSRSADRPWRSTWR